jgi:acyl-coenzyme A synthetase/AMP-(fatty) acid ligase
VAWFVGGQLNVSYNCVDRHVENGHGSRIALIREGNDPHDVQKVSYLELQHQVCQLSNALLRRGVRKGDRYDLPHNYSLYDVLLPLHDFILMGNVMCDE